MVGLTSNYSRWFVLIKRQSVSQCTCFVLYYRTFMTLMSIKEPEESIAFFLVQPVKSELENLDL